MKQWMCRTSSFSSGGDDYEDLWEQIAAHEGVDIVEVRKAWRVLIVGPWDVVTPNQNPSWY